MVMPSLSKRVTCSEGLSSKHLINLVLLDAAAWSSTGSPVGRAVKAGITGISSTRVHSDVRGPVSARRRVAASCTKVSWGGGLLYKQEDSRLPLSTQPPLKLRPRAVLSRNSRGFQLLAADPSAWVPLMQSCNAASSLFTYRILPPQIHAAQHALRLSACGCYLRGPSLAVPGSRVLCRANGRYWPVVVLAAPQGKEDGNVDALEVSDAAASL